MLLLDVLPAEAMSTAEAIQATLRRVDPETPVLAVTELAASRGDGVFETLGVVGGHPQAVAAHLDRLERSALMLDLPRPHRGQWQAAIEKAAQLLSESSEGKVKLVLSRGIEGTGRPTAWLIAEPVTGGMRERTDGIRVVLLDRGLRSDVAATSPWLLAGAKTLSYASNMAALREAGRRGADDVIYTSTDGFALEGPTSSIVLRRGAEFITPRTDVGVLAGTTQLSLFAFLASLGHRTREAMVTVDELFAADGLWLLSSSRLAAGVTMLDGRDIPFDPALTARMNTALLARED